MIEIPDLVTILPILRKLSHNEDRVAHAIRCFWAFYEFSMDTEALQERIAFFKKLIWERPDAFDDTSPFREVFVRSDESVCEVVQAVIRQLDAIEASCRVPYEPDEEDSIEDLLVALHLTMCRAVVYDRRRVLDNFNEFMKEAERLWRRLEIALPRHPAHMDDSWIASTLALGGILHLYCYRDRCDNGLYSEALHVFAESLGLTQKALQLVQENSNINWMGSAEQAVPRRLPDIGQRLAMAMKGQTPKGPFQEWTYGISADESARTFEALKTAAGRDTDWKQVTEDCVRIQSGWGDVDASDRMDLKDTLVDTRDVEWSIYDFWQDAAGWARAQVSPSDLRDFLNDEKRKGADLRLQRYFFGDLWAFLPEQVRQRLINVDQALYERVGDPGGILDDLRVATATLFRSVLWERCMKPWYEITTTDHPKERILREKFKRGLDPSLEDMRSMLRSPRFKDLAKSLPLRSPDDATFICRLGDSFHGLSSDRQAGDYRELLRWEDAEKQLRKFLGIDQQGILPRLARIGRDMGSLRGG